MKRLFLFGVALLAGCGKVEAHPPFADSSCSQPPCVGGSYPGTDGPVSKDAGPVADASTRMSGDLGIFSDAEFVSTDPFLGSGTIDVFSPSGPTHGVTGDWVGSRYSLEPVPSSVFWAEITASSATDVLPTLSPIVEARRSSAGISFARASAIEQIFSGLTRSGQGMLADRAQIVIRFLDTNKTPLAGVRMSVVPDGAVVAYDDGPLYSDRATLTATQARGTVAVLNAAAPAWPGDVFEFQYESGTPLVEYNVDIFVAAGAVSVITVPYVSL